MNKIIEEFKKFGNEASYHFADDSGAEWKHGNIAKRKAMCLFDENPKLQDEMKKVAEGFLWRSPYIK